MGYVLIFLQFNSNEHQQTVKGYNRALSKVNEKCQSELQTNRVTMALQINNF